MVEKLSAAAAGGGGCWQRERLPALFVGHCSPDYEPPFHSSVTFNQRRAEWKGSQSGTCRPEEVCMQRNCETRLNANSVSAAGEKLLV